MRDFYEILGLKPESSVVEVKRAYRRLARRYHPDTSGHSGSDQFRNIQEAYETLSDPDARASYDRRRSSEIPVRVARRSGVESVYEVNRSGRFQRSVYEVRLKPRPRYRDSSVVDQLFAELIKSIF